MKKLAILLTLMTSFVCAVDKPIESKWAQLPEDKKKEIISIVRHNPQKTLELQETDKNFKEIINTFEFYQALLKDQTKDQTDKIASTNQ